MYTRFIDDITLSANFNIKESGLPHTIERILERNGFRVSKKKRANEDASKEKCALNLRLTKPHPDVKLDYFNETVRRLKDHAALGRGEQFDGPFFMPNQLYGRVRYILWVNPNRRHMLLPLWHSLDCETIIEEAKRRGILVRRKRFVFQRVWR